MNRSGSAFTLLELVVVTAIVFVLASLLLPSLQSVRSRTYAIVDVSQLKQIGHGLEIYKSENDDQAVLVAANASELWGLRRSIVSSPQDPTADGYSNCFRTTSFLGKLDFKSSYVSLDEDPGLASNEQLKSQESGWAIALLDKPPTLDEAPFCDIDFQGAYLRLTFGGSVVRRNVQRFESAHGYKMYYNSLFTDDRTYWRM